MSDNLSPDARRAFPASGVRTMDAATIAADREAQREAQRVTPAQQSVTIIGPNLRDQSRGDFVVHAAGCGDIARAARRDPEYLHGWTIEATSRCAVVEAVYGDIMDENDAPASDYLSEVHFCPCVDLPVGS